MVFCLVVAWLLVRHGVVDGIAAWKGNPSPRIAERQARDERARERGQSGPGRITDAVSERLANRISNPPQRKPTGPARAWLAEYWDDIWSEATEKRLDRRQRRMDDRQAQAERAERERRREEQEQERIEARREREDRRREREEQEREPHPVDPDDDPDVIDAEVVEPEPEQPTQSPPNDPPDPEPPLAPVINLRKDSPLMTSTLNGETLDPVAAAAFALQCKEVLDEMFAAIDQSVSSLEGRGVKGAPLDHLQAMKESVQIASSDAEAANGYFEEHKGVQGDLASNEQLAGTVEGTYVDGATG